jgi:hypothetical protein
MFSVIDVLLLADILEASSASSASDEFVFCSIAQYCDIEI